MATRLLFASLPKTNPKTKPSQHRTPFSAVATPHFPQISRLKASRILETIYEEETTISGHEGMKRIADHVVTPLPSASASYLMSKRSTFFGQMQKPLSKNSDNLLCGYGSTN
ncbi:hypothetical protein HanRHA438_Chr15g0707711 [Helianthus annuus]|uniref:Uncharacterized protein n=1 Tax=Helianthus annuus TaxID=4232 RepID=A0A9K3H3G1_HELAN|nr:hypothetical protein HanXRQr2_Chr15g0695251 [Helianthus annuus]KAJ0831450.1 hypothetical protein HanPSC8_Chr15g0667191 [Helianthus annuus]KAJ0844913.1 hypothetical protein HanRHA438_Chr15g0707711 [Helianthus annuus]